MCVGVDVCVEVGVGVRVGVNVSVGVGVGVKVGVYVSVGLGGGTYQTVSSVHSGPLTTPP